MFALIHIPSYVLSTFAPKRAVPAVTYPVKAPAVALTVPEHVIVSHHGAGDMSQLPPLVIESVNVSYNPNNSSFFVEDGHPVEVGMSVTLKEIVPIYKQDVEGGM